MKEISFEETKGILMDLITDLDCFCREKGLRYSLAYGTLIGAVRHRGFIPWDDDIDIFMPRPDFMTFIQEYSHPYYVVAAQENNPEWPLNFAKLMDDRTVSQDSFGNVSSIAVDIFILDGVPDIDKDAQKFIQKVKRYYRLWSSQLFTKKLSFRRQYGYKKNILIALSKLMGLFVNYSSLLNRIINFKKKYPFDKSSHCSPLSEEFAIFDTRDMVDTIDAPFENKMLRICRNYDSQLHFLYGEYMTIPPEEERYNHKAIAFWK